MSRPSNPLPHIPIRPGDVIQVQEPDYMYGRGVLRLRVTVVGTIQHLPDGRWLDVCGLALRADGSQIDIQPRQVLVRVSALRGWRRAGDAP